MLKCKEKPEKEEVHPRLRIYEEHEYPNKTFGHTCTTTENKNTEPRETEYVI